MSEKRKTEEYKGHTIIALADQITPAEWTSAFAIEMPGGKTLPLHEDADHSFLTADEALEYGLKDGRRIIDLSTR